MNIMKNASEELNIVKGEAGEIVSTKLEAVLKKKSLDFRHLPVPVRCQM
jgi:hypothetical protein